jgi:putative tryptophan/tyrosine transport system substrate-binding protein
MNEYRRRLERTQITLCVLLILLLFFGLLILPRIGQVVWIAIIAAIYIRVTLVIARREELLEVGTADDLVGEGLVDSLARPGGHTTGVSILATELDGKRQELLIKAVPGLRRMAALAVSNVSTAAKYERQRAHNIELSIQRVAKGEDIATAIDAANASGAEALNVLASPMLHANRQLIMDRVAALRLPASR